MLKRRCSVQFAPTLCASVLCFISTGQKTGRAEAQPLHRVEADAPQGSAEKVGQAPAQMPTIGEKTAGMQKLAGYFNLYWDAKQGKLWLEIDKWGTEFLYQSGLPAGIGSNDIGLDRGQLGATRIVRFDRSGPKVLLMQENLEYRAVSNDPDVPDACAIAQIQPGFLAALGMTRAQFRARRAVGGELMLAACRL